MALSHKAPLSMGGGNFMRSPLASLPPVKLDSLTKWEQMKIHRKLAHMNNPSTANMEDSESKDEVFDKDDEEDEGHMPYDSSDERDHFDPGYYYYHHDFAASQDLDD
ncbi:hypothetical protein PGQ11_004393 [Apiospora arundinis]|uniref:Uncharacterized protein n=1 Tax=Apiospora arundinis TaxID=335852 RepID=A0ABR2J7V7_9PEZI